MIENSDAPPSGDEHSPDDTETTDAIETTEEGVEAAEDAKKYVHGQVLRFIRVRFPGINRSQAFLVDGNEYLYGQKVVASSERGMSVGFVNSFPYETRYHRGLSPIRRIVRAATAEDLLADRENFFQEKRLETICYKHIEAHNLDMQLTNVELTQAGKKATFNFTAPTRIDFRGLVHDLVGELRIRVELRQVTVRDRSASVGGLGPCGRELCCSSFLAKYGNVGIKLAKNQDLSLNSSKINGVCGQLKCCLTYEDEVYQEKRKRLPRDNGIIKTKDGNQGKVIKLDILSEQFDLINPDGVIRRYVGEMWDGPAEGLVMPKFFENGVNDQRKTIIGLDEQLARHKTQERDDAVVSKAKAKEWVDSLFENLFGEKSLGLSMPELAEPDSQFKKPLAIDEEEELTYVPPEDEILDEDDDEEEDEDDEGEDLGSPSDDLMAPKNLPKLEMPPGERPPMRPQQSMDIQQGHRAQERGNQRPGPRPDNRRDHAGQPPRDDRPRADGHRTQNNQRNDRPRDDRPRNPQQGQRPPQQGPGQRPPQEGGGDPRRRRSRGGRGGRGGGGGNGGGNGGGGGSRPPQG
jgi:cell fate regulator YaaT (PSP1 superfamily)